MASSVIGSGCKLPASDSSSFDSSSTVICCCCEWYCCCCCWVALSHLNVANMLVVAYSEHVPLLLLAVDDVCAIAEDSNWLALRKNGDVDVGEMGDVVTLVDSCKNGLRLNADRDRALDAAPNEAADILLLFVGGIGNGVAVAAIVVP